MVLERLKQKSPDAVLCSQTICKTPFCSSRRSPLLSLPDRQILTSLYRRPEFLLSYYPPIPSAAGEPSATLVSNHILVKVSQVKLEFNRRLTEGLVSRQPGGRSIAVTSGICRSPLELSHPAARYRPFERVIPGTADAADEMVRRIRHRQPFRQSEIFRPMIICMGGLWPLI